MKKITYISLLILLQFNLLGQDVHYSEFQSVPIYLNPAFTGLVPETFRIGANYRVQWASVTVPYVTQTAYADRYKELSNFSGIGFGGVFIKDKSGDAGLSVIKGIASLAYHYHLDPFKHHTISGGFNVGFEQRSLDASNLIFPDQNDGKYLNGSIPTSQVYSGSSFISINSAIGIHYGFESMGQIGYHSVSSHAKGLDYGIEFGYSLQNLTKPLNTFTGFGENRQSRRHVLYATSHVVVHPEVVIYPQLIFMRQDRLIYNIVGVDFEYILNTDKGHYVSTYLGPRYRFRDALLAVGGFRYNGIEIGGSYDFNISSLSKASGGWGGFEIFVIFTDYLIGNKVVHCPKF